MVSNWAVSPVPLVVSVILPFSGRNGISTCTIFLGEVLPAERYVPSTNLIVWVRTTVVTSSSSSAVWSSASAALFCSSLAGFGTVTVATPFSSVYAEAANTAARHRKDKAKYLKSPATPMYFFVSAPI